MTRIITKYPNAVKWGKRGTKITGGIAVAVFIGPLAAAPFVVDGVIDAGTEVMIISEDPDAYWLGVVSNYEDATSSVVGWTSSSWDATKGWTSSSWDDTKVWSSEAWGTTKDWSSNSWDSTKGWSSNTWDTTKDWSSEVLEGVKGWDSGLNK
jgi:hypothetical protein